MSTDSKNNMMNRIFSFLRMEGGRFLLLILLFNSLQMIQAVCRSNENTPSDHYPQTDKIFVVEGTIISGMEQIHIPYSKKVKEYKSSKRKGCIAPSKRKAKKLHHASLPLNQTSKTVSYFSKNNRSETYLLTGSDYRKQIFNPDQYKVKFLTVNQDNQLVLLTYLLGIFFKTTYKSCCFSHLIFCQNFKRPPPVSFSIMTVV